MISRKAIGCLGASGTLLAYTWYTKPKPYPPLSWSEQAKMFSDQISLGLGPFQYYCPESGAINNPTDQKLKPGLDAPSVVKFPFVSGLRMLSSSDYEDIGDKLRLALTSPSTSTVVGSTRPPLGVPVTVSLKRNIKNIPFSSVISMPERREVEAQIVEALKSVFPESSYHGFIGSQSMQECEMSLFLQDVLRSRGLLFEAPWTTYDLSCGSGRHWPDARGIGLIKNERDVAIWINGEDHLEIVAVNGEGNVKVALSEASRISSQLEKHLTFASDAQNGYHTMKPENSGLGMKVFSTVSLPFLSRHPRFSVICSALRVNTVSLDREASIWNLNSYDQFGLSQEECAVHTAESIQRILDLDKALSRGEKV